MDSVNAILGELSLDDKPSLLIFNKTDKLPPEEAANLTMRHGGLGISALDSTTLDPMLVAIEESIWHERVMDPGVTDPGVTDPV